MKSMSTMKRQKMIKQKMSVHTRLSSGTSSKVAPSCTERR